MTLMHILFGIQGTGNGHISRGRMMAKYLAEYNVKVTYLISGRKKSELFDMEIFGDFIHRKGLTFITENGQINYAKTAVNNNIFSFLNEVRSLDVSKYDLIISDFEPVCAWAGKRANKPTLGIGHQYAFGEHTPLAGDTMMTRAIMRNFAPTQQSIGLHWHQYDKNILPPIVDTSLVKKESSAKPHILVYLPFENVGQVCELLSECTDYHFIIYAPKVVDNRWQNIDLKRTSYQAFKHDLACATGVICNAGFELISECLHIGIPVLTKPLQGQMEQHANAKALSELNYATVIHQLEKQEIMAWLKKDKLIVAKPMPNVAKAIAERIANNDWNNIEKLGEHLWDQSLSA